MATGMAATRGPKTTGMFGVELDLEPVGRETMVDRVHDRLRQAIKKGQLAPGQSFTIRNLAASLNVSPMPIRGALHQLVAEGALEALPNRTVRVPEASAERSRDLAQIRASLEALAIKLAAVRIQPKHLRRLETLNERYHDALMRDDQFAISAANEEFHATFIGLSGSPPLIRLLDSVWLQTGPFVNITFKNVTASQIAVRNHVHIIEALRRKDATEAEKAVVVDILEANEFIVESIHAQ